MILIEIKKEARYLKKNSQTPQEKNSKNLNRSNVKGGSENHRNFKRNFIHSDVYGRRKYAEFRELVIIKSYEMNIQTVSKLKFNLKLLLKNGKIFRHELGTAY